MLSYLPRVLPRPPTLKGFVSEAVLNSVVETPGTNFTALHTVLLPDVGADKGVPSSTILFATKSGHGQRYTTWGCR